MTSAYLSLISDMGRYKLRARTEGTRLPAFITISAFRSGERAELLCELLPLLCECEVAGSSFLWI